MTLSDMFAIISIFTAGVAFGIVLSIVVVYIVGKGVTR